MNIGILKVLTRKGMLLLVALFLMVFALAACGETAGEGELEAPDTSGVTP